MQAKAFISDSIDYFTHFILTEYFHSWKYSNKRENRNSRVLQYKEKNKVNQLMLFSKRHILFYSVVLQMMVAFRSLSCLLFFYPCYHGNPRINKCILLFFPNSWMSHFNHFRFFKILSIACIDYDKNPPSKFQVAMCHRLCFDYEPVRLI